MNPYLKLPMKGSFWFEEPPSPRGVLKASKNCPQKVHTGFWRGSTRALKGQSPAVYLGSSREHHPSRRWCTICDHIFRIFTKTVCFTALISFHKSSPSHMTTGTSGFDWCCSFNAMSLRMQLPHLLPSSSLSLLPEV